MARTPRTKSAARATWNSTPPQNAAPEPAATRTARTKSAARSSAASSARSIRRTSAGAGRGLRRRWSRSRGVRLVNRHGGFSRPGWSSGTKLVATVRISKEEFDRTAKSIPADVLDVLAAHSSGTLHPSDQVPMPWTDDELRERESEAVEPVEAKYRALDDSIIENADAEAKALERLADDAEAEAHGPMAAAHLAQAARYREQAEAVREQAAADLAASAERLHDERDEVIAEVGAEARQRQDAYDEAVESICNPETVKLDAEHALNVHYFGVPSNYRGRPPYKIVGQQWHIE